MYCWGGGAYMYCWGSGTCMYCWGGIIDAAAFVIGDAAVEGAVETEGADDALVLSCLPCT